MSAPSCCAWSTWRGVSGWMSTAVDLERPAVARHDALEVRRLRREPGDRLLDERVLVVDLRASASARARSRSSRRPSGPSPARRTASRRDARARPRTCPGSCSSLLVERAEDVVRALALVHREVGAGDVADEQRVAGQHRPRLVAALRVDQGERRVLGAMARRVDRADADAPELELPAVVERARGRSRATRRGARGSSRRSPPRAARAPRRGRRGCASRGCARCARRGSARGAGTRRSRASGRPPRRRPRPRRRSRYDAQPRSSWVIWRKIMRRIGRVLARTFPHARRIAYRSRRGRAGGTAPRRA